MAKSNPVPKFSAESINVVAGSLREPLCDRRHKLLTQVLREWSCTDLREHLSREPGAVRRERIRRLESVGKCALQLLDAIGAVDELGRTTILFHMIIAEGRRPDDVSPAECADLTRRWLDEEADFLAKLGAIKPREFWKQKRGQPRNIAANLVLRDIAAIFEWVTGIKAARVVDRIDGAETGPFFQFASTLWPLQHVPAGLNRDSQAAEDL
jgi:hypothetical protein